MYPIVNLEEIETGGNDFFSNGSVMGHNTPVLTSTMGTNDEKNLIQDQNIDFRTRMQRHTEKENEISINVQVRKEKTGWSEGFSVKDSAQSFSPSGKKTNDRNRHQTEEIKKESFVTYNMETLRVPLDARTLEDEAPNISPKNAFGVEYEKELQTLQENSLEELQKRNKYLVEALVKVQKTHSIEKKRFNEILFGIDKALSSLPIRLEKIRVRNQRNLSVINSSRFNSGDASEITLSQTSTESPPSEKSKTSQESSYYVSSRMKCLLDKLDQLNDLIKKIQKGESPIELLVSSELYAISLLKKEINSTKKQIDSKSDSETVTSCDETSRDLAEYSSTKAKNSFSNELNKASNFKIFENHMMLQEEALNLLTRKIKETEEALAKEMEAKEALKRENEAMAKEIFLLKSKGGESMGRKSLKTEKLKPEAETTGNRPYKLIKELKTKLDEKEKSLVAWKSKCSRMEAAASNKNILMEAEKKKNLELESSLKEAKAKNKSVTTQLNSLQCLNEQLKNQVGILQQQIKNLKSEKVEESTTRSSKLNELSKALKIQEQKLLEKEEEARGHLEDIKNCYEKELENVRLKLKTHQEKNIQFEETFQELLLILSSLGAERDTKNIKNPSYNRIREILQMSPSDYELLFNVYTKSSIENETALLYQEFQTIVEGKENSFSNTLSTWLFEIIVDKLLCKTSNEKQMKK